MLTARLMISCWVLCCILISCSGIRHNLFVPSDIKNYCMKISESDDSGQAMKTCVRQEQIAKDRLDKMTVPPDVAKYCRRLTDSTGGSHQVFLACLQQELSGF